MSRKLKVGCAQLGAINVADSRESVVKRLVGLLREAAASGCKLVVFPELALTTFFPRYLYETQPEIDAWFEASMPNDATQILFDEAKRLGVGFYLGYAELCEEQGVVHHYNTAILVDANADIIGKYRKVHLPGHKEPIAGAPFHHLEKRYFEPGDLGFPVWRGFDTILGMCICNDRRWPETYRVMGLQGVEMVLLGYNTPVQNIDQRPEPQYIKSFHNHLSMQAGAYQNASWVIGAAKAGFEDGHELMGGSCIIAPTGEIVALATSLEDELVMHSCDLELGRYLKETTFNFGRHRRVEHYGLITSQTGAVPPPE
ncbi:MAG: N-carbamoyl-D-amino-acid hydrolase [Thiotrichales bacterium]|nr:N-carbamoyl-D-amino-acid hydrolase [Thiotrichales bacterium]